MSRGPASWRARRELARRDQRGVVVPLVAVAMVVLLLIAAFVLDLGVARTRSRSIQSAVDLAALAAGPALGRDDPRDACAAAVENLRSNVTEFSTLDPTTACANLPTAACSSPSTVSTATHTSGGSTLRIRYPATDAAIAVSGSTGPWPNDGSACRRMTVELTSTQTTAFGGITGNDETSVTRSATVLGRPVTTADVPALWLLDPTNGNPQPLTKFDQTDGVVEVVLPPGLSTAEFPVVDISEEVDDGDTTHSGKSILRGELA